MMYCNAISSSTISLTVRMRSIEIELLNIILWQDIVTTVNCTSFQGELPLCKMNKSVRFSLQMHFCEAFAKIYFL